MTEGCASPFLIIAGSYRAGSTALFEYLAAHPRVCASDTKETGYFLPYEQAPGRPGEPRFGQAPLAEFLRHFPDAGADATKVHVEATPSYLHFPESARAIAAALPCAKIVLSLRDPVARLVSWYQTARMLRGIPPTMGFAEYVAAQLPEGAAPTRDNFFFLAQTHGRYAPYVASYFEVFGRERVMATWFDDLATRPNALLMDIARFAGLDEGFYRHFRVRRVNAAKKLRDWGHHVRYRRAKALVSRLTKHVPMVHAALSRARRKLEPVFYDMISVPADPVDVPASVRRDLERYYAADARELARLLGESPRWARA